MSSAQVTSDAQTYNSSVRVKTEDPEHEAAPATDATSSPLSSPLSLPPPSSPPLLPKMADRKIVDSSEAMPPPSTKPSRNRSNDEMQGDAKSAESLQTMIPAIAQLAQQGKTEPQDIDSSAMMMPDSQTQGRSQVEQRADEPLPGSVAHSQKAPPSAQGYKPKSKAPKATKAGTKKGKKTAKEEVDEDVADDENGDETSTSTDSAESIGDPQDQIVDFDWINLNHRYHQKMKECNRNEQAILAEFGHLCFHIWADSGNGKESERSFKRFKTQELYVQHEEDELERKRGHYIRVVEAFQTVAHLLVEHSPNLTKDVVMNQLGGKPTSCDKKERPIFQVTLSASTPKIVHDDLPEKTAGDIDMRKYRYRGHHGSRCVIL